MTSSKHILTVLLLTILSYKQISSAPLGCFSDCMNEVLFDSRYHGNITEILRANGNKKDECTRRCFPQFEKSENPGLDRFYMAQRPLHEVDYKRYYQNRHGGNEETFFTMKIMIPIAILIVSVIVVVRKLS